MLLSRSSSFLPLVLLAGLLTAGCEPSDPAAKPIPTLASLANSPSSVTLQIGATQALAVNGQYSDGSSFALTNRVSFASANAAVATVSSGGVITAVAAGTTSVTATDPGSGKTASTSVTVPAAVPVSIVVEPRVVALAVDATQALTVVATYPNASTGPLTAGVTYSSTNAAVASVSDTGVVSGVAAGTATVTATHTPSGRTSTASVTVTPATQAYAVIDFGAAQNISLTPFGGEVASLVSTGVPPGGPAGTVARLNRAAGSQCWAGTTVSLGARQSVGRLPFSATLQTLTVLMHVPASGMVVRLKAENADDPGISVETDVVASSAGWQTLSFNFGQPSPGTAALNTAATYNKVTVFPNFSCPANGPVADEVFHVALIAFPGASGPSAPPLVEVPTGQSYTVLDFNTAGTVYTLTSFGGQTAEVTAAGVPAGGPGGSVVKVFEPVNAECWSGTTLSTGPSDSIPTLPVSATAKVITAQFHAPASGLKIKLKLENAADPTQSVETDATSAAGWQTLSFDFGTQSPGTAAIDFARTYNKLSLFTDFTCGAPPAAVDQTFYLGPVVFLGAAAPR